MNAYVDASVILRILFSERGRLRDIASYSLLYSSALLRTECYRTVYRLRLENRFNDEAASEIFSSLLKLFTTLSVIPVTPQLLKTAEQFFPVSVGTLDSIHLASALALPSKYPIDAFLTHDKQLATAAIAMGLNVRGI